MTLSTGLRIVTLCLVLGIAFAQESRKNVGSGLQKGPRKEEIPDKDDDGTTDECPEPFGFFADAEQCDKYYACTDGVPDERLCPDGMVFNDFSPDQEKCDLPFNIDCSTRSNLQTPRPTQNCPRLNGYFAHEDESVCDKFFYCVAGKFNMITCPGGLVFNPKTGICTWPDEAGRTGCLSEDVFQFTCPKVNESTAQTHPRYADPDDCQFFYVCINGEVPRRNGCKLGQAFDEQNKHCEWARKVPECADWYKDRLTDAELDELENPKPKITRKNRTKGPSRRKQPKKEVIQDDEEEDEE